MTSARLVLKHFVARIHFPSFSLSLIRCVCVSHFIASPLILCSCISRSSISNTAAPVFHRTMWKNIRVSTIMMCNEMSKWIGSVGDGAMPILMPKPITLLYTLNRKSSVAFCDSAKLTWHSISRVYSFLPLIRYKWSIRKTTESGAVDVIHLNCFPVYPYRSAMTKSIQLKAFSLSLYRCEKFSISFIKMFDLMPFKLIETNVTCWKCWQFKQSIDFENVNSLFMIRLNKRNRLKILLLYIWVTYVELTCSFTDKPSLIIMSWSRSTYGHRIQVVHIIQ